MLESLLDFPAQLTRQELLISANRRPRLRHRGLLEWANRTWPEDASDSACAPTFPDLVSQNEVLRVLEQRLADLRAQLRVDALQQVALLLRHCKFTTRLVMRSDSTHTVHFSVPLITFFSFCGNKVTEVVLVRHHTDAEPSNAAFVRAHPNPEEFAAFCTSALTPGV